MATSTLVLFIVLVFAFSGVVLSSNITKIKTDGKSIWDAILRFKCTSGFFGRFCNSTCPSKCSACKNATYCTTCDRGMYGLTCTEKCSRGCSGGVCHVNGTCKCNDNFMGEKCDKCLPGYYGQNCDKYCPSTCVSCVSMKSTVSNVIPVTCNACKHPYYGMLCQYTCMPRCLSCSADDTCHSCITGYYGDTCQNQCPPECKSSGCNQKTGACETTFDPQNENKCPGGKYGDSCVNNCSSHCVTCSQRGECTSCKPGYHGALCDLPCDRHCVNVTCDVISGRCLNGCAEGYREDGATCLLVSGDGSSGEGISHGAIIGIGVSGSLLVLLLCGAGLWLVYRTKRSKDVDQKTKTDESNRKVHEGLRSYDTNTWNYQNLVSHVPHGHVRGAIEKVESEPDMTSAHTSGHEYQSLQDDRQGDSYMSLIVSLADGEVKIVPVDKTGRENGVHKEPFRSRATTTGSCAVSSWSGGLYKNIQEKRKFQSEADIPAVYENAPSHSRNKGTGKHITAVQVPPKQYENITEKGDEYLELSVTSGSNIAADDNRVETDANTYYSIVDIHM